MRPSRFTRALGGGTGIQVKELPVGGRQGGGIFFHLIDEPVELRARHFAAAKKGRHGGVGHGAVELDVGVVGRGGGGLVHQREPLAQGAELGRTHRQVAAEQSVGAAEIDPGQLVVRASGEDFLERRDAFGDGGAIARQAAGVERADRGIVRQSEGAGDAKKRANKRKPGRSHLETMDKASGKNKLGLGRRPFFR